MGLLCLSCQTVLISLTILYFGMENYIGMDFHLYLLTLYSPISAVVLIQELKRTWTWENIKNCFSDYKLSFCGILEKDESFSIQHKNNQNLVIKTYTFFQHNLSSWIMNNIFKANRSAPYDLRKRKVLQSRNSSSVRYGTKTMSYITLKIWSIVLKMIKNKKLEASLPM